MRTAPEWIHPRVRRDAGRAESLSELARWGEGHRTPESNRSPTDLNTRYLIPKTYPKVSIFPIWNILNVLVLALVIRLIPSVL